MGRTETRNSVKVAYLAGKVSGRIHDAKREFKLAQKQLESLGYTVWNPLERANNKAAEREEKKYGEGAAGRTHWQQVMRKCIFDVCSCHEVWLLPGWRDSDGAQFEVLVAHTVGVPVFEYKTAQQIASVGHDTIMSAIESVMRDESTH